MKYEVSGWLVAEPFVVEPLPPRRQSVFASGLRNDGLDFLRYSSVGRHVGDQASYARGNTDLTMMCHGEIPSRWPTGGPIEGTEGFGGVLVNPVI